ncbi:unnamed protein product, partial [Rotaria magnacalcarata]
TRLMATNSRPQLSQSEIELINRVNSYFPKNNPTKFIYFYRNTSPFSNFYPSQVNDNGIAFHCIEQYMMYHKAKLFNDDETAERILDAKKPAQCKALGREVEPFNEETWMENRTKIVSNGNYLKFTTNQDLKAILLQHKDALLVEAAPNDRIWGVGLAENNPLIQRRSSWKGLNLLGYILTDITYRIIKENETISS